MWEGRSREARLYRDWTLQALPGARPAQNWPRTTAVADNLVSNISRILWPRCGQPAKQVPVISLPDRLPDMVVVISFGLLCLLSAVLAWIDIRQGTIPDWLNLTIGCLGLSKAVIIGGLPAGFEATGEGAAAGIIFWLLRRLYFAFRQIQGLGLGDVKFLAAAGIWSGMEGLPILILVAALAALVCAGFMRLAGQRLSRQTSMPFGPFLAIGLLFTLALQQQWPIARSSETISNDLDPVATLRPAALG